MLPGLGSITPESGRKAILAKGLSADGLIELRRTK